MTIPELAPKQIAAFCRDSRTERLCQRSQPEADAMLDLASHAALPVALNTELLHFLRINFFLDSSSALPYTAEFELLFSPLFREVDEDLYEMEPAVRDFLLKRLYDIDRGQRLQKVATLLWQYLDRYSPWGNCSPEGIYQRVELARAQQLTALNFLDSARAEAWLKDVDAEITKGAIFERDWYVAMRREISDRILVLETAKTNYEPWPPLETFDFTVAEFVDWQRIPHRFEVATVEVQESGGNWFGRKPESKIVINRQVKEDWQYVETLDSKLTLELVNIPAGRFTMGAPKEELESRESERPPHPVTVPEFYMGKYLVTQAQWRFGAGLPKINRDLEPDPSRFKGDDLPVERVSWLEAIEFCARLSIHTGREYRLTSEAEWEYACRAGTVTPFHFGETIDPQVANYNGNYAYDKGQKGFRRGKTTAVGAMKVANLYGLYDMHGNVWEWCQDHWHNSYQEAPQDGSAWINPKSMENSSRVLRGGAWTDIPRLCRSAVRLDSNADSHGSDLGFRVVCPASTL
jgi:formylglycine-generating enzyme required for sulfatase activity